MPISAAVNAPLTIRLPSLHIPTERPGVTRLDPNTGIPLPSIQPIPPQIGTDAEPATEARRPVGRPRKSAANNSVQAPPAQITFDLLILSLRPDKRVKRGKANKQEPLKYGPVTIPFSIAWTEFMECLAAAVQVPSAYLQVQTFEYHPSVPANHPKVPVTNEAGLTSMLGYLTGLAAKKPLPIIMLRMKEPQYVPPVRFLTVS